MAPDNEDASCKQAEADVPLRIRRYRRIDRRRLGRIADDVAEVKDTLDGIRSRLTWILIFIVGALVYAFFR